MKKEVDVSGGALGDVPNKNYEKFFKEMREHTVTELSIWRPVHVFGFFCDKFKTTFGKEYELKFNSSAPSKCFEIFQIKKLSQLLSSKPSILKEYIDWVFEDKVIKPKKNFRSISFLNTENFIKEYKWKVLTSPEVTRTTPLPQNIKDILVLNNFQGELNYASLAFLRKVIETENATEEDSYFKQLRNVWKEILATGFDITILEKMK